MTIKERQEREAHDRENPWRPISTAKPSGLICDLQFDDLAGHFATDGLQYFLDVDGSWYQIDPPAKVFFMRRPIDWRPSYVQMTPERRALIKRKANG
ncbi:hypothetical protein AB9F36_31910 [Rhizobium leguminosarum]|uniref:hypothetical protein n=1 Tax=Rhizobium leguminosarum TaxID=384 RepID=UPI003F973BCF